MDWIPRIGEIRRSRGLQQNYVAKKIHVSSQSLSDWERGKNYPKANYLYDLAELLECDVNELYTKNKDQAL